MQRSDRYFANQGATGGGRRPPSAATSTTRDDMTNEDLHARGGGGQFDDFKDQAMVKVYTSGSLLEDREIPVKFQRPCFEIAPRWARAHR